MAELHKVEKAANIENTICLLNGELQETVQDFVNFLRANGFQMSYNPEEYAEGTWRGAIGGIVGNSLGYMAVSSLDYMAVGANPKSLMVWPNVENFDENDLDSEMKEFIWTAYNCRKEKCHEGWEKCGSNKKTILGKAIENACCNPLMFVNPNGKTLENMKKLFLLLQQKEDKR